MRARDLMSRPVYTVRPDTPVGQAAALLAERGFAALPVVAEYGRLAGIVSRVDLPGPAATLGRVGDVMTREVISFPPDAEVAALAHRMLTEDVASVPIVEWGDVVGMVSRSDLLRLLEGGDDVLGSEVQRRLDGYAGGLRRWTATVADGVVHVAGECDDEAERRIVTLLAETVPGVTEARLVQLV